MSGSERKAAWMKEFAAINIGPQSIPGIGSPSKITLKRDVYHPFGGLYLMQGFVRVRIAFSNVSA